MKKSPYIEYILDLLYEQENITSKSMFGGYGIYKNKVIFGIIADDELYFKSGDANNKDYDKYDAPFFMYNAKGKDIKISYRKVPLEIMEDSDMIASWLNKSYEISYMSKK